MKQILTIVLLVFLALVFSCKNDNKKSEAVQNTTNTWNTDFLDDFDTFKQDVPIILNGISFDDQYDGDFNSRRVLIYTLDFTMKMSFYGPVAESKVIRKINIDFTEKPNGTNNLSEFDITIGDNDTESDFTITTTIDNTDFE